MKGKHANAAEKRRHLEALEKRATEAERQVEKLTAELAALREATDRQLAAHRARVAELTRRLGTGQTPELDAALQYAGQLRAKLQDTNTRRAGEGEAFRLLKRHAERALSEAGVSRYDIEAVWTRAKADLPESLLEHATFIAGTFS